MTTPRPDFSAARNLGVAVDGRSTKDVYDDLTALLGRALRQPKAMAPDDANARLTAPLDAPPATGEESITPPFLTAVMRRAGVLDASAEVTAVTSTALAKQGTTSTVVALDLTYGDGAPDDAPTKLIGKFLPREGGAGCSGEEAAEVLSTECNFFKEVPAEGGLPRPTAYYADGPVILMEKIEGQNLDVFEAPSDATARDVLRDLAHQHASYWGGPAARGGPHTAGASLGVSLDYKPYMAEYVSGGGLHTGVRVFPPPAECAAAVDALVARAEADFDAVFDKWKPATTPLTLVMGDANQGNMFAMGDGRHRYVDFGATMWDSCSFDTSLFLVVSLDPVQYDGQWEGLLRHYHDMLVSGGVVNYSWEDCRVSYLAHVETLYYLLATIAEGQEGLEKTSPQWLETPAGTHSRKLMKHIAGNVYNALRLHAK